MRGWQHCIFYNGLQIAVMLGDTTKIIHSVTMKAIICYRSKCGWHRCYTSKCGWHRNSGIDLVLLPSHDPCTLDILWWQGNQIQSADLHLGVVKVLHFQELIPWISLTKDSIWSNLLDCVLFVWPKTIYKAIKKITCSRSSLTVSFMFNSIWSECETRKTATKSAHWKIHRLTC